MCVDKKAHPIVCDAYSNFGFAIGSVSWSLFLLPHCRLYGAQSAYVCTCVCRTCCLEERGVGDCLGVMHVCVYVCVCGERAEREQALL